MFGTNDPKTIQKRVHGFQVFFDFISFNDELRTCAHPECPKRRGFVRANLMLSSTVFEAAEGGVNYTSFVHTDPCGKVMFREIETLAEDNGNSVINVSYKIPVVDNRDTCFFSTEFPGLPDNPDKSGCMYIAAQSVQAVVEFLYACPMPDYEATKADIQEKAKQVYAMPASAWTLRQEKDGAKVMVAEMPGSSFLMVRTEVFLPLPLEDIMPLYKNNDLWKEWSPELTDMRDIMIKKVKG
eukprot:gene2412-3142_t